MDDQNRQQRYIEKRRSIRIRRSQLLKITENVDYKIATSTEELEQAFELVTQQYTSVGMHKNNQGLRLTKYHLLPDSKVFIATKNTEKHRVIGTLTIIPDTSMGLPMDEIYSNQLKRLRITGLQLAEVIGLAVSPEISTLQKNIVMYLFKICLQFAHLKKIDDLLCAVKPEHISFYEELLLFKPIGEMFPYSCANNQPIQGHRLNLHQANKEYKKIYSGMEFDADLHRFFFTETQNINRPYGKGDAMTPEQMRYFIEQRTQLVSSLTSKDKRILRDEFKTQDKIFSY